MKPPALILYWEYPRATSTKISGWRGGWMEATDLEASHPPLTWTPHFPLNVIPPKKKWKRNGSLKNISGILPWFL